MSSKINPGDIVNSVGTHMFESIQPNGTLLTGPVSWTFECDTLIVIALFDPRQHNQVCKNRNKYTDVALVLSSTTGTTGWIWISNLVKIT